MKNVLLRSGTAWRLKGKEHPKGKESRNGKEEDWNAGRSESDERDRAAQNVRCRGL